MKPVDLLHLMLLLAIVRQSSLTSDIRQDVAEDGACHAGTVSADGCPSSGYASCIMKDDVPTKQELIKLDIPTRSGKALQIKARIGVDYSDVGTCLLNDSDGRILEEIEHDYSRTAERVDKMFNNWLSIKSQRYGKMNISWGKLIECLKVADLHTLAEDIESILCHSTNEVNAKESIELDELLKTALKQVPSIVDKDTFEQVLNLISDVRGLNKAIMSTSIAKSDVIENASIRLESILNRLIDGRIRAGVVGLTKAGKSTMLNALLGEQFLPGSVQPQTAKEVSIVHTTDTDGDLYGVKGDVRVRLAKGHQDIHETLVKFNNASRKDLHTGYDKLYLHAPLHFLSGNVQDVQFELSDTPGLGEAGSEHFAIESELAVRDMCAFVIVMKLDYLKSRSEADLLMTLSDLHPKLFTHLNRILILINAYELAHEDKSKHNLQADRIQGYISDYLREPNVLGKVIPREHIIPFSALWGLRSRLWLKDPNILLSHKDARNLYSEALVKLDRAGYDVELLRGERNEEKVHKLSMLLEDFSHIKQVESNLSQMLRAHGARVLLESSVDDTLSVLDDIRTEASQVIVRENLKKKEAVVEKVIDLLISYRNTVEKYINVISELDAFTEASSRATVTTLADSLEDRLNSIVNDKVYETLRGTIEHEDKNHVQSKIVSAKASILSPATTRMKVEWLQVTESLHKAIIERVKGIISDFKIELVSGLSDEASQSAFSDQQMMKHSREVATVLTERLNSLHEISSGFLPPLSNNILQLELTYDGKGSDRVADDALTQRLSQGKKTKYNLKSDKICFGRRYVIAGPKDCVRFTVAEPYDAPTYTPDFVTIQSDFSEVVKGWIMLFKTKVDNYRKRTCDTVMDRFKSAVHDALSVPTQLLEDDLQAKEAALDQSKATVAVLNSRKSKLNVAERKLETLLTKFSS